MEGLAPSAVLVPPKGTTWSDPGTAETILAHPRFELARDHYMQVMIDCYRPDRVLQHLLHEVGRTVLFNIILGQHERHRADPTEPLLTVGRLRALFMPFRLASPRSFDQIIARMCAIGLVKLLPVENDRRRKRVLPTSLMIEQDLTWIADHMSPLAVLYSERTDYQPALERDIRYQRMQRIISTEHYQVSRDTLQVDDPVLRLMQRQEAYQILFSYMLAARAGGNPYRVALPYEKVAAALLISRTHVRNLLTDLAAMQLVQLHGRGGSDVVITPALWRNMDSFLARAMWGHDLVWQKARRRIAESAQ